MVSPEGAAQGLGARSAQQQSPAMMAAVEQMPPEYSDLKLTKLSAKITPQGGAFNFDIPVVLEPRSPRPRRRALASLTPESRTPRLPRL